MNREMKQTLLTLWYVFGAVMTIWCVRSFLEVVESDVMSAWNLFNLFIK